MADSIGVRRLDIFDNDTSIVFNGVKLPMEEGILDSVEIADFKFYNIPVGIYKFDPISNIPDSLVNHNHERKESLEYFSNSMSIVMGYPAMFLMGKIIVDFENNVLSFPDDSLIQTNNNIEPNLFAYTTALFTRLYINDIPFTAHVDFGSTSYMQIHSSFYEKNKCKIPVKSVADKKPLNISMIHNTWLNIPYEIPENPILKFNSKIVLAKEDNVIEIYSLSGQSVPGTFDGHIGYPFFRNLGKKILLDFDNMRIDIIE